MKLDALEHEVLTRGPEGDQVHYDDKGKRVRTKARVEYLGFQEHRKALLIEAGLLDQRVELVAEELRRSDSFWGTMPALNENDAVVDEVK